MTGSIMEEDNDKRKEVEQGASRSTPETAMCQKQQHKSNTLHKVN
jgi:hypothetical protein